MHTDDPNDETYLADNQTQFVAWAIGPRATEEGLEDLALFHSVDFSRSKSSQWDS